MLVEPTPLESPTGRHRRRLLAVAIPVAVLAGVVAVALAGSLAPATPELAVAPVASHTAPVPPSAPATMAEPSALVAASVRYPTSTFGLPTRTVTDLFARVHTGRQRTDAFIAVRGWLTIRPDGFDCTSRSGPPVLANELCGASGILRDDDLSSVRWADGSLRRVGEGSTELHPRFRPGVSLWGVERDPRAPSGLGVRNGPIPPVPVVLIGRFSDPRSVGCAAADPSCGEGFVVERVVWVDGTWRTRPVVESLAPIRAGLDATDSRQVALDAYPGDTIVLSQTLLPASLLDRLDPSAADAIAAAEAPNSSDESRLWYLRLMRGQPSGLQSDRSIAWVVVDDRTGAILATEPAT